MVYSLIQLLTRSMQSMDNLINDADFYYQQNCFMTFSWFFLWECATGSLINSASFRNGLCIISNGEWILPYCQNTNKNVCSTQFTPVSLLLKNKLHVKHKFVHRLIPYIVRFPHNIYERRMKEQKRLWENPNEIPNKQNRMYLVGVVHFTFTLMKWLCA